ncbi:MAG: preprotein translocase subunit SecY [archaeon]|nr:preprotein translocase subunit SecY [archaeon]
MPSILAVLDPVYRLLPEVKKPEVQGSLNKRITWTLAALVLFFIMGNISVIGIEASTAGQLAQLQTILASQIGTIITVGIGPIVLASIILQLLVGGGLIQVDLTDTAEKARFTSMQKLLAIILCFVEAGAYVFGGLLRPAEGMFLFVILQVAIGSLILMFLDEVVSKHGIGSGISLFIAGGVAGDVIWRIFNPLNSLRELTFFGNGTNTGAGLIWQFFAGIQFDGVFLSFVTNLLPIVFTLVVFFAVVFAEGMHINIPIAVGRAGHKARFPVKFLYVSNIPVILAAALFANIQLWSTLLSGRLSTVPVVGIFLENGLKFLATIVIAPFRLVENFIIQASSEGLGVFQTMVMQLVQSITTLQLVGLGGQVLHGILYIFLLTVLCVIFGKFWVEMAGQGPQAISNQLEKSGMFIPGFRRDPRVVKSILERYIPPISILGSMFVGLLAGFADLTGALGSGTGILLTVGIVYRLYEELAKQQLIEMHPVLGQFFG